jgi:hypothetical protein
MCNSKCNMCAHAFKKSKKVPKGRTEYKRKPKKISSSKFMYDKFYDTFKNKKGEIGVLSKSKAGYMGFTVKFDSVRDTNSAIKFMKDYGKTAKMSDLWDNSTARRSSVDRKKVSFTFNK